MPTSGELTSALDRVHESAKKYGGTIIPTAAMARKDRELLLRTKWLQEIIKGWYMLVRPDARPGDSLVWYTHFWDFVRIYLEHHYGEEYCLSAENSLELHLGTSHIPKQVLVITARGGGKSQQLLFDTSVFIYADSENLPLERMKINGIQVMTLPYALCKVTPTFFQKDPLEAKIALKSVRTHLDLVQTIVKYKFRRAAARIVGAYRYLGDEIMAQSLEEDLAQAGMLVKGENPFEDIQIYSHSVRSRSPHMARIFTMWETFREPIIEHFPLPQIKPENAQQYFQHLETIYSTDAYNSLSIEGYVVDQVLIERVKKQNWNPDINEKDREQINVLAARGYFESYQEVKKTLSRVFNNVSAGEAVEQDLQKWYRALFYPSMRAGILPEENLYGYRKWQVYIRHSRHVPLPKESLLDAMEALFTCLKNESHAAVRAILGHFIFVFIHPYMDGNGRIGRFLMNVMFASGGYPWTIIQVKDRNEYFKALEAASVDKQIIPFIQFISSQMNNRSLS